jgi:hypothetical protein
MNCPALLLFLIMLMGCQKNNPTTWNPTLKLPLLKGQLKLTDLVGDSLIYADASKLLHVHIDKELIHLKLDSALQIPDTSIQLKYSIIFPVTLNPGQNIPIGTINNLEFKFDNGIRLKTLKIKQGQLRVKFKNTISQALDVSFSVPDAQKNSTAFTILETIPSGTAWTQRLYDLSGFELNLHPSNTMYNTLRQSLLVKLNAQAPVTQAESGQGIELELEYINLLPEYVLGYFGTISSYFKQPETKIFDADWFKIPQLQLQSATATFSIINAIGADLKFQLDSLYGKNNLSQSALLNAPALKSINISRAQQYNNQINPSIYTLSLNSQNSTIHHFLSIIPNMLYASGDFKLNPFGNTSGYNDFLFFNQGLQIKAHLDIPLAYTHDYIQLEKTFTLSTDALNSLKKVTSASVCFETENTFPFSVQAQALILNSQGYYCDSVFQKGPVDLATCNPNLNGLNLQQMTFNLSNTQIQTLIREKKLHFRIKIYGLTPQRQITLLEHQKINFNLYLQTEMHAELQ